MHALLANLSDPATRTRYEFARVQSFSEWWQMPLLVLVCALVLAYVAWLYRRDSVELKPGAGVLLALLRLAAFAGLLLAYLDLQKRTETKVVHNSRVALLVDASLSMARVDSDAAAPGAETEARRIDRVRAALSGGTFLETLRETHDVTLARFDAELHRIVTLPRQAPASKEETDAAEETPDAEVEPDAVDWSAQLEPTGAESRIAESIRQLIDDERGTPLSGIVLVSDGAQNAGVELAAAIRAAQDARIPVHAVGVGSAAQSVTLRVSDLIAPARAYPRDGFQVTGYLQSRGLAGRQVDVDLAVLDPQAGGDAAPVIERTQRVSLAGDAETIPVRFELPGIGAAGRRTIRVRVKPIAEDRDPADNQQEVEIDVVDRRSRVLLIAGGPSREYQFLRNLLRRSELADSADTIVDVWLQSAGEGASQDANQIVDHFPVTMQELSEYDAIVAFDPDWRRLDPDQVQLLESWIGEHAGGMIVIAGPVYTDAWVPEPAMATLRALYPVEFNRRLLVLDDAQYGSLQPWPLEFTREGLEAEVLWLGDDAAASQEVWDAFDGVYGFYRVRGAKVGATTYALFSDPEAAIGDQKPVYMAEQFYGSGRVFYLGSGEMWRLRELGDNYFDAFYTKLIRHVSQGRLVRGSRLGTLLVERDRYMVGNTILVRAQLSTPQLQPLEAERVILDVAERDGPRIRVPLLADPVRKGMFSGQFTATREGECRLELTHPDQPDEVLSRRVQVFIPKLEQENPERNDKFLKELSEATGGQMYVGLSAAIGPESARPLVAQLQDMTQETYVSGKKDRSWEQRWMHWLLGLIAGCLSVEWLIRRLCRLA